MKQRSERRLKHLLAAKTLRKADLLSLQTALEGAQSLAAVAETEAKARREEARGAVEETTTLAAQLSGVASANKGLLEARERLAAQSAEQTKLNAAMTERVRSLEAAAALARASEQRQEEQLQETRDQFRDAQMEVHSLARDVKGTPLPGGQFGADSRGALQEKKKQ